MTQPESGGLRVRVKETGGVTGPIAVSTEVSERDLSESEKAELRELLRDLPPTEGAVADNRQGSTYVLDVEGDGEHRSFTFNDKNGPDAHRRLVGWLKKRPAAKRSMS
jgi:hypothetical protein